MNPSLSQTDQSDPEPSEDVDLTTRVLATPIESFFAPLVKEGNSRPELLEVTTRYHVECQLARGGMGIIYKARDIQLDRHVAIKILREKFRKRTLLIQSFLDEVKITSSLLHPGIAQVFECGTCDDGRPFYSMKLVNGNTLQELLTAKGPKEKYANALNIFASVCQTMAYTHSRGVIHLDLKPANVMVGAFGEVHVMDWGLARFVGEHEGDSASDAKGPAAGAQRRRATSHGANQVHGTLEYMSPEQARGMTLDARTDVFGLGAILAHILTGSPPFTGKSHKEVYKKAAKGLVEEVFAALDACDSDAALVRLAKRCLTPEMDMRPANAGEVSSEMSTHFETALDRMESDMNRFFDLSLDLFCIAGLNGYFRRINSNFMRVLGHSEQELLTTPFMEFVHPDDRNETEQQMAGLMKGKPVVRFRNRYRASNGDYLTFEWTAKSIPAESIIFAVARNIS